MGPDEMVAKYSEPLPCDSCEYVLPPIGEFSRSRNYLCKKYSTPDNAKPHGVLFCNEKCPFHTRTANDGGPGSGNFGHKGRPGLVGGSGPGGGKQYRGGRSDIGYFSSKKDWLNGLQGEEQSEASKLLKNGRHQIELQLERKKSLIEKAKADGHDDEWIQKGLKQDKVLRQIDENTSPEEYIMKFMEPSVKKKLIDYVGKARSWNEKGIELQLENLSPEDRKRLVSMVWELKHREGPVRQPIDITPEEYWQCDLDRVFDQLSTEEKEFYIDMKAKACGLPTSGKDISEYSDEFQVETGDKEKPKTPESFFDWIDNDSNSLSLRRTAEANLRVAGGLSSPWSSMGVKTSPEDRVKAWKNALNNIKYGSPSQSVVECAAKFMRESTVPMQEEWQKLVKNAKETGEPLPNLTKEETDRFIQLLEPESGTTDATFNDVFRLEDNLTLWGELDEIKEFVLLKNKIISPIQPDTEEEIKARKEAEKQELFALYREVSSKMDDLHHNIDFSKSTEEVEGFLNDSGIFAKGYSANLKGISHYNAMDIAYGYSKVVKKYPFLSGFLHGADAGERGAHNYASCSMIDGKVSVNTKFYGDYIGLKQSYANAVKTGYHPEGTDSDSIMVHELAHAIDGYLSNRKVSGSEYSGYDTRCFSGLLRRKVLKSLKLTQKDVGKSVSRYAQKNAWEWFAESFSEALCSDNPRPVAVETVKQLDEILKEEGLLDA